MYPDISSHHAHSVPTRRSSDLTWTAAVGPAAGRAATSLANDRLQAHRPLPLASPRRLQGVAEQPEAAGHLQSDSGNADFQPVDKTVKINPLQKFWHPA